MHKAILFASLVGFLFLVFFAVQYIRFSDHLLHVIFCDVGQGDGILIRTPSGKAIVVDGGPDNSILRCLAEHMPFWQKSIDMVILTHPHADHLNGLDDILHSYSVRYFVTEPLHNDTAGHRHFLETVEEQKIPTRHVLAGDRIQIGDGVVFSVLGPSKEFLTRTSPKGTIGESSEFGSLIIQVSYGAFDVLLTGDSQVEGMKESLQLKNGQAIEVLHVPHHGSRFGLDKKLIEAINPKLAVISVGKNKYGHPAPFTLDLLKDAKIPHVRTDEKEAIELVSDGKKWGVKE